MFISVLNGLDSNHIKNGIFNGASDILNIVYNHLESLIFIKTNTIIQTTIICVTNSPNLTDI